METQSYTTCRVATLNDAPLIRSGAIAQEDARMIMRRRASSDDRPSGQIAIELGCVHDDAVLKHLINWTAARQEPMRAEWSEPASKRQRVHDAKLLDSERRDGERRAARVVPHLVKRSSWGEPQVARLSTCDVSSRGAFLVTHDTSIFHEGDQLQMLIGVGGRHYADAALGIRIESHKILRRETGIAMQFARLEPVQLE